MKPLFQSRPLPALLAVIAIVFAVPAARSGPNTADSLLRRLPAMREDSLKVKALLIIGTEVEDNHPDSALRIYQQALAMSCRVHFRKGEALYANYALAILTNACRFEELLQLCKRGAEVMDSFGTIDDRLVSYNNLANAYQNVGMFSLATEYYLRSLRLEEQLHNKPFRVMLLNNLSSVFNPLGDYGKAYGYASQAYNMAADLKDSFSMGAALVNLGVNEIAMHRYAEAERHLDELVRIGLQQDSYTLELDGKTNLAELALSRKDYSTARRWFSEVIRKGEEKEDPGYQFYGLDGLIGIAIAEKDYAAGNALLSRTIGIAREIGAANELRGVLLKASTIRKELGDYPAALRYREESDMIKDSTLNAETHVKSRQMEIEFQTAEKNRALAAQTLELQRSQNAIARRNVWLWVAGIGILASLIIGVISYWLYRQRQRLIRQRVAAIREGQALARMRASIEGQESERRRISKEMHDDIGSGLTTIMYLSAGLQQRESSEQVSRIASITHGLVGKINEIIWSMNSEYDTLEDLLIYLRQHAAELLEANDLAYEFEFPDEVPNLIVKGEIRRNIYLCVEESLHNIIKHSGAQKVFLSVHLGKELRIVIRDDGKGIALEEVRRFGNGLRNMRQRMQYVGGSFDIEGSNGTVSTFVVPLQASKDAVPVMAEN